VNAEHVVLDRRLVNRHDKRFVQDHVNRLHDASSLVDSYTQRQPPGR
jgi:hypothetical protein